MIATPFQPMTAGLLETELEVVFAHPGRTNEPVPETEIEAAVAAGLLVPVGPDESCDFVLWSAHGTMPSGVAWSAYGAAAAEGRTPREMGAYAYSGLGRGFRAGPGCHFRRASGRGRPLLVTRPRAGIYAQPSPDACCAGRCW